MVLVTLHVNWVGCYICNLPFISQCNVYCMSSQYKMHSLSIPTKWKWKYSEFTIYKSHIRLSRLVILVCTANSILCEAGCWAPAPQLHIVLQIAHDRGKMWNFERNPLNYRPVPIFMAKRGGFFSNQMQQVRIHININLYHASFTGIISYSYMLIFISLNAIWLQRPYSKMIA